MSVFGALALAVGCGLLGYLIGRYEMAEEIYQGQLRAAQRARAAALAQKQP